MSGWDKVLVTVNSRRLTKTSCCAGRKTPTRLAQLLRVHSDASETAKSPAFCRSNPVRLQLQLHEGPVMGPVGAGVGEGVGDLGAVGDGVGEGVGGGVGAGS